MLVRRFSTWGFAVLSIVIVGCGQTTSAQVSGALGASALPSIKPPAYVPGPLNGQSTPRRRALRRPLAVIIENFDPDSRPQSGLGAASMVIETLAEDGITRFMPIYLEGDSNKVGPIRSTRMYFDHYAGAFHAILAHVGGNDDAQAHLWHMPSVFNIDENRWEISLTNTGTPLFWRSTTRVPPHNMYANTYKLRAYASRHKQNWAYSQANVPHKSPASFNSRGHGGSVSIGFVNPLAPQSNPGYAVRYQYDRSSNSYPRFMGGTPHIDANTGKQLHPSNVIVVRTGPASSDPFAGITPQSILIPTLGSGRAWYFMDGKVKSGTWRQAGEFAPLRFYDRRGHELSFNPGQSWVEVVPSGSSISWNFR